MKNSKMWKRIVSLVMAICMISGLCVTGVFAEEETETLKAIKVEIDWNDTVSTNSVHARMCLKSMEGKTINAGDTLSYQVYIPSDGNYVYGMGAFDGQSGDFAANGYWFPNFQDGAGMNNYDQLDLQGTDCWITREYKFDTTASFWHLGPAVITVGNHQALAGKVSTVYYRNIVIKRADGTVEACYTDDAAMVGADIVEEAPRECTFSITEGSYSFKKAAAEEPPAEEPVAPEAPAEVCGAIEFSMAFQSSYNTDLPAAAYNWYGFGANGGAYSNIKLTAGDKLSYKVYIPSGSAYVAGMAMIDLQETAAWGVLSWTGGVTDQNGNPYYSDLAALYGRDKWIELTYDLPANLTQGGGIQHIGPRNNFGPDVLDALKGQNAYFYFNDVKIIHADGTADIIVPDETKLYNVNPADDFILPYATVTNRVVPEAIGNAMEITLDFNDTYDTQIPTGNVRNWYGFGNGGAYAGLTLAAGDKLAYKIYIPSDGNYVSGLGMMDMQETSAWRILSDLNGIVDQNGNGYNANIAEVYGTDKWVELVYELPAAVTTGGGIQHIGPRNSFSSSLLEGLKGKSVRYYLNDVKIIHADGTESLICPPTTTMYNVNSNDDQIAAFAQQSCKEVREELTAEAIGSAVKISLDFGSGFENVPTEGNVYNWFGFGADGGAYTGLTLAAGDKLAYKIYIPSNGNYVPGMAIIDLQENAAWGVLSWQPGMTDQNGNGQFVDLAETYGTNRWINLVYEIPANLVGGGIQHIGPRHNFGAQYLPQLEGKTAYYYLTDVKLIHADGTETAIAPPETRIYNTNANDPLCSYATVSAEYLAEETDLSGVSMALGDDLAVKFHVQLDAAVAAAATMKITVGNDAPITVKASEAQRDTDGNYIFVAHAAAAQMNDTIVLEQIYNAETTQISTYSVCKYAAGVLKDATLSEYHELVKQMLNYGAAAQKYFDYNADAPANDGITVTLADVPQSLEENMAISGAVDGISFYGATAVFRSKTAVRYYFNVTGDINDYTFTVGDTDYEPVAKNDMYYIEVPGVNPQQIDETVTLNVTDGTETLSVTYSPLCYIVRMYNGNGSEELKSLLKALYSYYLEAEAVTEKNA